MKRKQNSSLWRFALDRWHYAVAFSILVSTLPVWMSAQNAKNASLSRSDKLLDYLRAQRMNVAAIATADSLHDKKCGFWIHALIHNQWQRFTPSQKIAIQALLQQGTYQKDRVIGRFHLFYDTTGVNAPSLITSDSLHELIPNTAEAFVDSAGKIFNEVYHVEVEQLGYDAPPFESGETQYRILIGGISDYGLTNWDPTINPLNPGSPAPRFPCYVEINNNFKDFYTKGMDALRVTAAHEFHHVIQIGSYGYWQDDVYAYELTSTWMEDVVYTDVNDYYQYLSWYFIGFRGGLAFNSGAYGGYERSVWAHFLSKQFGADTSVITFEQQAEKEMTQGEGSAEEAAQALVPRSPVVTIMGHVDHGKTSLLDSIRHATVAEGEAGGITQHIGAYKVTITDKDSPAYGRQIVFLDTPGHEAFTRMRSRGAKVTDIVVLVVAADDGVMPQTLEAIDHARAANVPIIVAVNKIDKPEALPERVKKQLADRGLMPEDWGGQTVFVEVSAKKKTNLNLLMEMICLVADLQDLKANPERAASGVVLEAKLDRGRGPVATVLVQNGTLKTGEYFVVGNVFGRVRAMFDEWSNPLDEAGPSTPVEILGLEGLPQAGDNFIQLADREKAVGVSEYRTQKAREATLAKTSRVSLEGLAEKIKNEGVKELAIILKGDVQGSVEVLNDLLMKLSNDRVKIKVLRSGVGAINEGDVLLASASEAIIIGFNVRPERMAQELAEQEKVDIRLHSIIYELQDEIKKAMTGLLEPIIKETYQGRAEVRDTFRIPKVGMVAGCYIQDGIIKRDSEVRLLRDNVQVFKGKVGSLRRFKEDASEVRNGMECGIAIAGYGDVKVGDVIEAFVTEKVAAEAIA